MEIEEKSSPQFLGNRATRFEEIKDMAQKSMLASGGAQPMVLFACDKGPAIAFFEMPDETSQKCQVMTEIGKQMAEKLYEDGQAAQDAYFITEAWAVRYDKDEKPDLSIRPSESPNRYEILLITGRSLEENKDYMASYEILRDKEGKEVLGLKNTSPDSEPLSFESPLMDALTQSYKVNRKIREIAHQARLIAEGGDMKGSIKFMLEAGEMMTKEFGFKKIGPPEVKVLENIQRKLLGPGKES